MLQFLGFVFSLIIGIKLTLFGLHLLLAKFGRDLGVGTKWSSDKSEYVIIAGASGAIGSEYAKEFASIGFSLMLISRNGEKMKKLAAELKDKYHLADIKVVTADFSHPNSVETVKSAINSVGHIQALVNCMGISYPPKKFADYPLGFNSDMLNVTVVAPVLLIEMVLPKMIEKKRGIIINYSSMAGRFQFPYFSTFSASKSFMGTLSEILSVEYSCKGITVQNVEPLFVERYMSHLKPNVVAIPPSLSVGSSLREVGLQPTTNGFWKHKLVAVLLSCLVFLLGPRLATKIIGFLLIKFVATSEGESEMSGKNLNILKFSESSKSEESESLKARKMFMPAPPSTESTKDNAGGLKTEVEGSSLGKTTLTSGKSTDLPLPPPGSKYSQPPVSK